MEVLLARSIPILIGIFAFGILVLVHEMGHFFVAKKCDILVEEFAIGMGPKIFSFTKGETLFSIRIFPLGGFCRLLGDDDTSSDVRAFNNKTVLQRIAVILAGATMNLVLAFFIFTGIVFANGFATNVVREVSPNSPAYSVEILKGDKITKLDNKNITTFNDILLALQLSDGKAIEIEIEREGAKYTKKLTPYRDPKDGVLKIGFVPDAKTGIFEQPTEGYIKAGFFESISQGFLQMTFCIKATIYSLIELIKFNVSVEQMAGPIGAVSMIGDSYNKTIDESIMLTILNISGFIAMLSATIGVFNLLPIPALDGGRLVFLVIEGIRKKPISPEKEGMVHFVGFVILMALGVFIAYNDILKLI